MTDTYRPTTLTARSVRNLLGVHPDLCKVIEAAVVVMPLDGGVSFIVTEGLRTHKRQAQLVASGASKTMNSRHLTGHAVDVAAMLGGVVRWDWPLYNRLAQVFKNKANVLGIHIVWGGDWREFKDGPHFELSREWYK